MAVSVPLNWLNDYVSISAPLDEVVEKLTIAGLEVETVEQVGEDWDPRYLLVGAVRSVDPHPNADSLCLVTVDYGVEEPIVVVTGAPNIRTATLSEEKPMKVPLALVGATFKDAYSDKNKKVKLKPSKIRGIRSEGMICSELELGLGEAHEGILVLPEDAPVGMSLQEYLGDAVLHFDIKGGFAHLLSIQGIAREASAVFDTSLKLNTGLDSRLKVRGSDEAPSFVSLSIEDSGLCSRYSALKVNEVQVKASPFWMQQRLLHCGVRPINNIVDITNYVMLETGQPLHAFDYQKLKDRVNGALPEITVRHAHPEEIMQTLDGVDRKLDTEMLVIADAKDSVAIAGVMGGLDTEIDENTTEVLIESANFDFLNNRRTAHLLKLRTESSERFGKQLDPNLTLYAAMRTAQLVEECANGSIETVYEDLYPKKPEPVSLLLESDYVTRMLGITMSQKEQERILNALDFQTEAEEPGTLRVQVPSHRMDVRIPADLLEDLARVRGYNNMTPTLMPDELPNQHQNVRLESMEKVRDILVNCGLDEVITYSISNPDEERRLYSENKNELSEKSDFISLKNPLAHDRSHLRRHLMPGLLLTAKYNLRSLEQVQIFEVGSVFHSRDEELLPDEPKKLAVLMTGIRTSSSWIEGKANNHVDFYDLKGVLESLFSALHLEGVRYIKDSCAPFHPGRCARIERGGTVLGFAGELHPRIRNDLEFQSHPVCVAELDMELIIRSLKINHSLSELSHHTPVYEDLALIVDQSVPAHDVTTLLLKTGKPLLRNAVLFDLFEGEQVGENKKSLGYALTFQAADKTLTDKDVAKVRKKIMKRLNKELQVTLRSTAE